LIFALVIALGFLHNTIPLISVTVLSLLVGSLCWMSAAAVSLRPFQRIMSNGGHAMTAKVMGWTTPAWSKRLAEQETLWLEAPRHAGSTRIAISVVHGRALAETLEPAEIVTIYGDDDLRRGPVLVVGSRVGSTVFGWAHLTQY